MCAQVTDTAFDKALVIASDEAEYVKFDEDGVPLRASATPETEQFETWTFTNALVSAVLLPFGCAP